MTSPFHALLAHLDPDPRRAEAEFARLRRTLIKFFDWRGVPAPEDGADETLERLGSKLEEGVAVGDVAAYAHGIARMILHEALRGTWRHETLEGMEPPAPAHPEVPEAEELSRRLDHCLKALPPEGREMLLAYYSGGDGGGKIDARARLAHRWKLTPNALRSRVQRLRDRVETCVRSGERHVSPKAITHE